MTRVRRSPFLALLVLALAACSAQTAAPGSVDPTPVPADATPEPEHTATPDATTAATPATSTFAVGDPITITEDGSDWAEFTVLEVVETPEFTDPDGFLNDTPQTDGYVFIAARVRYEALASGVEYNPFDFQVFVDGQAVEGYTFALNGPQPELSSGTLPQGRTAEGWLLYEVPAEGEVLLSYTGNMFLDEEPVFEVVLRDG